MEFIPKIISFNILIYFLQTFTVISSRNNRPIVGILAQELPDHWTKYYPKSSRSTYIGASYVKACEASGARVVPIFVNQTESYYRKLLASINGVVIPGGGAPLELKYHGYYEAFSTIYKIAKEMNDNGLFFPIYAVCLGFEAILKISNNHVDIQTLCNVIHENYPLNFQPAYRHSLQFSNIPEHIYMYMKYFGVLHNNHYWCTTPENFTKTSLPEEWLVTGDNVNRYGMKFISTVEHIKYPFLATQFHPEKAMFEWKLEVDAPHSTYAIQANRYFYDTFIEQTRLNRNKFKSSKIKQTSFIYNYSPIYSEKHTDFDQIYVF